MYYMLTAILNYTVVNVFFLEGESDYVPLDSVPLTLDSNNRRSCVEVNIVEEDVFEQDEVFSLVLSLDESRPFDPMPVDITFSPGPVLILANDGMNECSCNNRNNLNLVGYKFQKLLLYNLLLVLMYHNDPS